MDVQPSDHMGALTRKLSEAGIDADVQYFWAIQRPRCASDAECAERVFIEALEAEIRGVLVGMRSGDIDSGIAYPILSAYDKLLASANDKLKEIVEAQAIALVQTKGAKVFSMNLGFTTKASDF